MEKHDLVILPGGFSFGDYLRCGAIAARSPIMDEVMEHVWRGGFVLGICNGFQILTEAGLLPGTLMRNKQLQFVCRDVTLSNHSWKARGFLSQPEVVFTGLRGTVAAVPGNTLLIFQREADFEALLPRCAFLPGRGAS